MKTPLFKFINSQKPTGNQQKPMKEKTVLSSKAKLEEYPPRDMIYVTSEKT